MVKVEEDPNKKIEREIKNNIRKIELCLPSDWVFDRKFSDNTGHFEGKISEIIKKTEKRFFRKVEARYIKDIANVCFDSESNSISLSGDENQLRSIAQKLEYVGYNVTIWT